MNKFLLLMMIPLLSGTGHAMGKKAPEGVSLLLVPARPSMVQLGMDMAAQKHALLMTYAPDTSADRLFLHIWDGSNWLRVPQGKYENGSFIKNPASRLVVVGDENDLTAALIEKAIPWSPEVLHLGSDNLTELINQLGRLYQFNRNDWEWIASRYDLRLEHLNRDREQISWYDQNKASELPPSERPWGKKAAEQSPRKPETSLSPVMPPALKRDPSPDTEAMEPPEASESSGTLAPLPENDDALKKDSSADSSGDFSLEMK